MVKARKITDKEKLEGYERTRIYVRSRLLESGRQAEDLASQASRTDTRSARAEMNRDAMKYRKRVNFWRHILDMLEPAPEVLTGIFPGAGRRAINKAKGNRRCPQCGYKTAAMNCPLCWAKTRAFKGGGK